MLNLVIVGHPAERMRERGVTEADIRTALGACVMHTLGSNSVTHTGPGVNGNQLKVWTLGSEIVHEGRLVIKSVAWRE